MLQIQNLNLEVFRALALAQPSQPIAVGYAFDDGAIGMRDAEFSVCGGRAIR
jgi:hypothetical protein